MTWIIGGNCYNGFACVADIQATISWPEGKKPDEYFNCIQKIHTVYKNLCVAFSGDIKSGLLLIESLTLEMAESYKNNEYFDVDGQSKLLTNYLEKSYKIINKDKKPNVELMFLWLSQEGDNLTFRPFVMTFKSPEFKLKSTPQLGVSKSGSGTQNHDHQSVEYFLSGGKNDIENNKNIFNKLKNIPNVWSVEAFKKFIFNEASKFNYPTVSKSMISFQSVIAYDEIYSASMHELLHKVFEEIGVLYKKEATPNYLLHLTEIDLHKVYEKITYIKNNDFEKYKNIATHLFLANESADFNVLHRLPKITSDFYLSQDEEIHSNHLLAKWSDFEQFFKNKHIDLSRCSAYA
jgi:hypothetical protein